MTPLADPDDVAVLLGVTFTSDQDVRAAALLDMASSVIRTFCNQSLTQVTDDIVHLSGKGSGVLLLPETPVTAVTSVVVGGTTVAYATGNDAAGYQWTPSGILKRLGGFGWACGTENVVVTYTHGYATIPSDIRMACAQIAAAMFQNPLGVNSETVDGYTAGYADTVGNALKMVAPYRLVPVG